MQVFHGLLLLTMLSACTQDDVAPVVDEEPDIELPATNELSTVAYKQLPGVPENLLSLDVYYTSDTTASKPVVLYVHGGGWSTGDKGRQLQDKIALFRDKLGYVLISTNYRLSDREASIDDDTRIKFPSHNEDVSDAVAWAAANVANYGGDATKLVLLGHSAGAHLVALTGTNASFLETSGLDLSALAGVAAIDTEGYDVAAKVADGDELYRFVFGDDVASNRAASPVHNVAAGKGIPPLFLGVRGTPNRRNEAQRFIDVLEASGVAVTTVDGGQYTHQGINAAIGAPDEGIITPALEQWLTQVTQ